MSCQIHTDTLIIHIDCNFIYIIFYEIRTKTKTSYFANKCYLYKLWMDVYDCYKLYLLCFVCRGFCFTGDIRKHKSPEYIILVLCWLYAATITSAIFISRKCILIWIVYCNKLVQYLHAVLDIKNNPVAVNIMWGF